MIEYQTHSVEESLTLGHQIGSRLLSGDQVLLFGEMGAGKTAFTLGLARGLGLSEQEYVRSPTFTLINEYEGRIPIYHLDLYRLDHSAEIEQLGLEELFLRPGVRIIEWAEKLFSGENQRPESLLFPLESWLEIQIRIDSENSRRFELNPANLQPKTHPVLTLQ